MNWKIGQKLVCIGSGVWISIEGRNSVGPKKDEIVTFDGMIDSSYVHLKEWNFIDVDGERISYNNISFRPLLGESAKSELISSFTEVTETSDLPIKQPEPQTV